MQIKDSLTLDASGLSRSSDGYLIGDARVARAGNVQQYLGREIGLTGDDAGKVFGIYRDPAVVFDEASMASLAGRPVTRNHPPAGVNAQTWRDLAVGVMGGRVMRDGEHVVASMAIMDATAAAEVEAGARSLSAGYTVEITKDQGVAEDGTPYQYRQSGKLRFNHVAYLPDNNPRAGNTRIGDSADTWGASPVTMSDKKEDAVSDALKTVVLGDEAVQVAVADTAKIDKWKAEQAKALADAAKAHTDAIAAKDEEIGKLKADLKTAQDAAKIDVDKLVADRSALVEQVKAIDAKIDAAGKTDADLRKAAVASRLGDEMVKDASEAEVLGMFKAIAKDAKPADPVRKAMQDSKQVEDINQAYAARDKQLADAWKTPVKEA